MRIIGKKNGWCTWNNTVTFDIFSDILWYYKSPIIVGSLNERLMICHAVVAVKYL